jgi:hypothetical protein
VIFFNDESLQLNFFGAHCMEQNLLDAHLDLDLILAKMHRAWYDISSLTALVTICTLRRQF